MRRPAEKAGAVGSLALIVARLAGVQDPDALAAIGVAAGALPSVVTFLVDNGGLAGVVGLLLHGRRRR